MFTFVKSFTTAARVAAPILQSRAISISAIALRSGGRVKWFDPRKGFGFIESDEEGPDLFVHWSNLQCKEDVYKTLSDDEVVEFDIDSKETSPGQTKWQALAVTGPDGSLLEGSPRFQNDHDGY